MIKTMCIVYESFVNSLLLIDGAVFLDVYHDCLICSMISFSPIVLNVFPMVHLDNWKGDRQWVQSNKRRFTTRIRPPRDYQCDILKHWSIWMACNCGSGATWWQKRFDWCFKKVVRSYKAYHDLTLQTMDHDMPCKSTNSFRKAFVFSFVSGNLPYIVLQRCRNVKVYHPSVAFASCFASKCKISLPKTAYNATKCCRKQSQRCRTVW